MNEKQNLLKKSKEELLKSIKHLEYSFNKTHQILLNKETIEDEEILESLEGLSSRFARTSDLFIAKFLKTYVQMKEPGFRGTLIDYLNAAEKMGLIESASEWSEIRELRNTSAHEYETGNLIPLFDKILKYTPKLIQLKATLLAY